MLNDGPLGGVATTIADTGNLRIGTGINGSPAFIDGITVNRERAPRRLILRPTP